jgi:voltage-gated potassium channel
LREANLRQDTGTLVLALRDDTGAFTTNPDPDTVLRAHHIVIAVGTESDLHRLVQLVNPAQAG